MPTFRIRGNNKTRSFVGVVDSRVKTQTAEDLAEVKKRAAHRQTMNDTYKSFSQFCFPKQHIVKLEATTEEPRREQLYFLILCFNHCCRRFWEQKQIPDPFVRIFWGTNYASYYLGIAWTRACALYTRSRLAKKNFSIIVLNRKTNFHPKSERKFTECGWFVCWLLKRRKIQLFVVHSFFLES